MRYHELLLEESMYDLANKRREKEHAPIIKKAIALIKKNCQPYLSQVKDPMKLRRGVGRNFDADPINGRPLFSKKKAHLIGRNPRGSLMREWHGVVNKYFNSAFGHAFRNGIMTVGSQLRSSGFGTDVAVFPIGEFKFLWSPTVEDLNHQIGGDWSEEMVGPDSWDNTQEDILVGLISNARYQTTDLQGGIESGNEIMIWAEEYYTLDNTVDRMLVKKLLR